jgi:protein N-terminal methyltransferase
MKARPVSGSSWYSVASEYWEKQPATVDGVLGGFSRLSGTDVNGSRRFLDILYKQSPSLSKSAVLDCGGGIGRVSKDLLLPYGFQHVDLLEPSPNLINQARLDLGSSIRSFLHLGLQDWRPTEDSSYSVIWAQWVLLYLTDEHLVRFFRLAASTLEPEGVIVLKENVSSTNEAVEDEEDNSVTRTIADYRRLAAAAQLDVVLEMKQPMWPSDLYPVIMIALKRRQQLDASQ